MSRLRALYARYRSRHFQMCLPGRHLPGVAGHLDRITYTGRGVILDGWADADSVRARADGAEVAVIPNLPRPDVASATGKGPDLGFRLELPGLPNDISLTIGRGRDSWSFVLPSPDLRAQRRARVRLRLRFVRDLLAAAPQLALALLRNQPKDRARAKARLGLDELPGQTRGALEDRLFDCRGLVQGPVATPITIVLPVYNGFDVVQASLRALRRNTDLPWHLVLIEDASTDVRMRPFLRKWTRRFGGQQVTYLENDENLGFVGSVNRGFEVALGRGDHVVLLNSDAIVPPGWASRLLRPMTHHAGIASVTPMSNDATILTAPLICEEGALPQGAARAMDAVAQQFNPEALLSVLPTGVGFCMALNIGFLRRVPRFDPAFGRGYCEEVDWCQRTRKLGGRHLGLPGLFVEHRGGTSFGSQARAQLMRRNETLISKRYPGFDAEVQQFMDRDPMVTARLALGMALIAQEATAPVPIYIAHSMGGGAETYLQDRIAADLMRGLPAVVLRVGGPRRWRVELYREAGNVSGACDDFDFVEQLLSPLSQTRVVYSNGVGDRDPVALPDYMLRLARSGACQGLELLVHDFFPLSPSYTLLDRDGVYRGPVTLARNDKAHQTVRPDGQVVELRAWRLSWGRLMLATDTVVVFSQDSRKQVVAIYPWVQDRISVRPHELGHPVPRLDQEPASPGAPEVIGVLGSIGQQKGAGVLAGMSAKLPLRDDLQMVLIGVIDPRYALPEDVAVTGPYQRSDIARLAKIHGVTRWLIPSIWPETFSFTTHEALATGLPVHAFDIGAQGEAVSKAPNGVPMPFVPEADLAQVVLASISATGLSQAA